jgi:acetolactate synthase-1/2/3 large subunit
MLSGRPRPAALQCPMDVWSERAAVNLKTAPVKISPVLPDSGLIKQAAKMLDRAKSPLIIVGGGAQDASVETTAVAEMLCAPVCAFRAGHGVIDGRHPLAVGAPLGRELWTQADAVLAVGTRLEQLQTWGGASFPVARIDIDADEAARHKSRKKDVAIRADAALALAALADALRPRLRQSAGARRRRVEEIKNRKAKIAATVSKALVPQFQFLRAIRSALDEDGVFVDEMTQIGYAARFAFPTYRPRRFLSTGYQGALGWGYAAALGAKAALPKAQVVSVCGDGGFLYNASELATAVRNKLGVVAVVFNDNAFGNVKLLQKERYRGRLIASELTNPDFVKLAQSFGATGIRAQTPAALAAALKKTLAADAPAVIEVPCREMPSPWQFMPPAGPPPRGGG